MHIELFIHLHISEVFIIFEIFSKWIFFNVRNRKTCWEAIRWIMAMLIHFLNFDFCVSAAPFIITNAMNKNNKQRDN